MTTATATTLPGVDGKHEPDICCHDESLDVGVAPGQNVPTP
ncbi:MAG: hypothetical protein ACYTGL_25090 [Planctomycetota bacterium]